MKSNNDYNLKILFKIMFLGLAITLVLLLSSCSHSKKVKKASNKIYSLIEKYPELNFKEDTLINFETTIKGFELKSSSVLKPFYYLEDSVVIKDSLSIVTIRNYSEDSSSVDVVVNCPDRKINLEIPFSFQRILATCNCKKEVRSATKSLKKKLRRSIMFNVLILIAIGIFIGFRVKKKIPFI